MKIILSCCLFFSCISLLFCQEDKSLDASIESMIINQDVSVLLQKHIQYNTLRQGVDGYRVQIFFDSGNNSRESAMAARSDVLQKFPEIPAYILWQQPNYKVRIGDCISKIEAQKILNAVKSTYINAYIVKDIIDYTNIIVSDSLR